MFSAVASAPGIPDVRGTGRHYVDLAWKPPKTDGGSRIKGAYLSYLNF